MLIKTDDINAVIKDSQYEYYCENHEDEGMLSCGTQCSTCSEFEKNKINGRKMKTDNELIAEFMNEILTEEDKLYNFTIDQLPYKANWNWLMPVVDKIETIDTFKFSMFPDGEACFSDLDHRTFAHGKRFAGKGETRLESTYKAVVQFINYYKA